MQDVETDSPVEPGSRLITENNKKKITDWLEKNWPSESRQCPICGHSKWEVTTDVVTMIPMRHPTSLNIGTVYPHIMVMCDRCSYTHLFNAVKIGIVPGPAKKDKND